MGQPALNPRMDSSSEVTLDTPIICRVTPWYFRRMSMMAGMLVVFGLYFLYDGKFGYPKANTIADKQVWFEEVVLKTFDEAKASGRLEQWIKDAQAQGWPTGREGEPPRWISYAAKNGWPEKPHRYTEKEIQDQFWWGGGTLLVGLGVLVLMLLNKNKTLRAEADHLVMPDGRQVFFADAFKVDKRLWDNKALAYVWHRPAGGKEVRAVIDDLKFDGAGRALDRLLSQFKGELIEKVAEPSATSEESPSA